MGTVAGEVSTHQNCVCLILSVVMYSVGNPHDQMIRYTQFIFLFLAARKGGFFRISVFYA